MPIRKKAAKTDSTEQCRRFLDLAREMEADGPAKGLDRVFDKVAGWESEANKSPKRGMLERRS